MTSLGWQEGIIKGYEVALWVMDMFNIMIIVGFPE